MDLTAVSRHAQRAQWKAWYSLLSWYTIRTGAEFQCMNWGYDDGRELVPPSAPERLPLQLYRHLVEGTPLAGKVVVDVSCGCGGGLAHLARACVPAEAIGLDFAPGNVSICRRMLGDAAPNLSFRVGDAEAIPLPAGSADVVLSVEASHCYGDVARFLDEARRVLRPRGHLLWADFAPRARLPLLDRPRERFEVLDAREITKRCGARSASTRPGGARSSSGTAHACCTGSSRFAAAADRSATVRMFDRGDHRYFLRRLVRGEERP
jgi:SAM-dependent methyltransferase